MEGSKFGRRRMVVVALLAVAILALALLMPPDPNPGADRSIWKSGETPASDNQVIMRLTTFLGETGGLWISPVRTYTAFAKGDARETDFTATCFSPRFPFVTKLRGYVAENPEGGYRFQYSCDGADNGRRDSVRIENLVASVFEVAGLDDVYDVASAVKGASTTQSDGVQEIVGTLPPRVKQQLPGEFDIEWTEGGLVRSAIIDTVKD